MYYRVTVLIKYTSMGLIERTKRIFCLEKCMILVSVDGFFQFLPKLVEEKVSSRTEKTVKTMEKTTPWKKGTDSGTGS